MNKRRTNKPIESPVNGETEDVAPRVEDLPEEKPIEDKPKENIVKIDLPSLEMAVTCGGVTHILRLLPYEMVRHTAIKDGVETVKEAHYAALEREFKRDDVLLWLVRGFGGLPARFKESVKVIKVKG